MNNGSSRWPLGGIGKTSLTRKLATGWRDHHLVDLTSIDDAVRVDETVARILSIATAPIPTLKGPGSRTVSAELLGAGPCH